MKGLDIAIAVPGLPFDGKTATSRGLGGSETAAFYMARELAKLGHHVRMFNNCDQGGCSPGMYEGVQYFALKDWDSFAQFVPHDVSIVQRVPGMYATPLSSRINWLWCHDLALGRQKGEMMGVLWNVDKVIVLSEYMKKQYQDVYSISDSAFLQSRNGIDLSLFKGLDNIKRHKNRIVYAARPERGLDNLLKNVFPKILEKAPDTELHLCGYENTTTQLRSFYEGIDQLIRSYGTRVVWHGALGKRALYELYASCSLYVYPTPSELNAPFCEISCISAMEAQAAGVPVVTTKRGALIETVQAGEFVDGTPWSAEYAEEFATKTAVLLNDPERLAALRDKARAFAGTLDWSGAAKQWSDAMFADIYAQASDPDRLATHFYKRSDIMTAREVIKRNPGAVNQPLIDKIEKDYYFTANDDVYREHYEKIGLTHGPLFLHHTSEARFQVLERWLLDRPECSRVVDYGCAYGSYLLNLAVRVPDRSWVGLDVDKNSIALATKHLTEIEVSDKTQVQLMTLEQAAPLDGNYFDGKKANAVVLFEVLEHVMDPLALLDKVEALVEEGGKVFITVPYGPWEYSSYKTYPYRCHLWEFDWHDLRDMFGKKKDIQIAPMFGGADAVLKVPLGWWLVEYTKDSSRPHGAIDMERKMQLQRPKQTVSATMIAGPNSEDNLHWCLKSVEHIADEIVLVDCGMSDEGRRIANKYVAEYEGAMKVVPGDDPKVAGFETPRNQGLKECTKDWILWLDTDEKLLNSEAIHKYLRSNDYNGYCIKQCHFACDTAFDPDTPVRLFRRLRDGVSKMRWFGMIHEHPELNLNEGPGMVITLGDVWIPHLGYLHEGVRRARFHRNYPLLMKDIQAYPERTLQKHFIIRDNMMLNMHEMSSNGGKITDQVRQRAEEVVDLYRKHFLGKATYAGVNTLQYYSQACQMLGLGAEVAFQVAASKTGTPAVNGTKFYRFATQEDFEAELLRAAREVAEPYMTTTW